MRRKIVTFGVITFGVAIIVIVSFRLFGPATTWDLSGWPGVEKIGWPASRSEGWYSSGRIGTLTVKFGQGKVQLTTLRDVSGTLAARDGDRLKNLDIRSAPETLNDAVTEAKRIAADLDVNTFNIDQWRMRSNLDGARARYSACRRAEGGLPEICVEIRPDVASLQKPWYVACSFNWAAQQ